jgi:4-amino-4-deoxy-L-arabinose transferase-like glycosyltransferase
VPTWVRVVLVVCLAAGLTLRAESLRWRAAWYDEVYSLWLTSHSVPTIVRECATSDPHPPGYYLLLAGWQRIVGGGLEAARTLSLVLWGAALLLLWHAVRSWFGWQVAAGATVLLSVHAFQVIASTEARMYMALQLAAVGSTWLLWRALGSGRDSRLWVAYGLGVTISMYLSYYSIFLLIAQAAFVFARLRWAVWGRPLAAPGIIVLGYLPWLPFLGGSVASNTVPWRSPPDAGYMATVLMSQVYGGHFLGAAGYYGGKLPGAGEVVLGLVPLGFILLGFLALLRTNRKAAWLVAWCWAVPLGMAVAVSFLLGKVAAYAYHLTYVQPFAAVLAAGSMVRLWSTGEVARRRVFSFGAAVVLLGYSAAGADAAWRDPRYQPFRPDLVAGYLRRLGRQDDTVVYMPQGIRRAVELYSVPPARVVEIRFGLAAWVRREIQGSVIAAREALATAGPRVWIVAGYPLPPGAVEEVAKAARELGYVLGPVAEFGGLRVGLLVERSRP